MFLMNPRITQLVGLSACAFAVGSGDLAGAADASLGGAKPRPEPKAGWIGVFPALDNYQRTFQQPVVEKDGKSYRQSARYMWMGGDIREATVTLARDPRFATAHTAAALKKAGAREITIGRRKAWIKPRREERGLDWIVIPLDGDTAILIEGTGAAHKEFPTELAGKFDPEKVTAALRHPPRTEFGRTLDAFKALRKGMPLADVRDWLGEADRDIGSGIHVLEYQLPDRSRVHIGFPSFDRLIYVRHEKDSQTVDLVP